MRGLNVTTSIDCYLADRHAFASSKTLNAVRITQDKDKEASVTKSV